MTGHFDEGSDDGFGAAHLPTQGELPDLLAEFEEEDQQGNHLETPKRRRIRPGDLSDGSLQVVSWSSGTPIIAETSWVSDISPIQGVSPAPVADPATADDSDSSEDQEEEILFYCKKIKSMGHGNAKFHVRSSVDPSVTACPSGGKISDLMLIPEETIPSKEVCLTCLRRSPQLAAWIQQRDSDLPPKFSGTEI